jgi:hypothetical protein
MGAIQFPLTSGNESAPNQVSPQEAAKLPASASGPSNVLEPDVVTLSATFPPAQAVASPNLVQFDTPRQAAIQSFPPHLANNLPNNASARPAVANAAQFPPPAQPAAQSTAQSVAVAAFPPPVDSVNLNNGSALGTTEQQQALQQLSQTLLELGINPQNISLENRLSLLPAANDPPALLNLVHALSVIDPQLSAQSTNNISNPALPAASAAPVPIQLQSQAQPQSQAQALVPLQTSNSSAGSGFESISQAAAVQLNSAASQNSQQPAANSGAAFTGNQAIQFQALQLAFQAGENSPGAAGSGGSSSNSTDQTAPSLNVLA